MNYSNSQRAGVILYLAASLFGGYVTLFVNTVLMFVNSPIDVNVEAKNRQDLEQVITYCDRNTYIDYIVSINFRYKWVKKFYNSFSSPHLDIINSRYSSVSLDKEDEYRGIISCENASQYIRVNLTKLSEADVVQDKLYFTLVVISNKTIKWDSELYTKLFIHGKPVKSLHKLFWKHNENKVKLVHREETI